MTKRIHHYVGAFLSPTAPDCFYAKCRCGWTTADYPTNAAAKLVLVRDHIAGGEGGEPGRAVEAQADTAPARSGSFTHSARLAAGPT